MRNPFNNKEEMKMKPLKQFRVLYSEQTSYKVTIKAVSEKAALKAIQKALEEGDDLNATAFAGDFDVISAEEMETGEVA